MGTRRWLILAAGAFAQAATSSFIYGVPMLVPALRADGTSLLSAALLASAPVVGVLGTLIVWGAVADRRGERGVIVCGVALSAATLAAAALTPGLVAMGVLLATAGAFGASVNAASGRVVMGWFPAHERGLAMGLRQTAQPLGVALAALGLPGLARSHGVHLALLYPAALCAVAALAVRLVVTDPPRAARGPDTAPVASPYRGSTQLARLHLASTALVVPQFAVATFTLAYLVGERHWDAATAGRMIVGFQVAGAVGRVVSGVWSDRVGSRLRPMRQLAIASAVVMLLIAAGAASGWWFVVIGFAIGSVVTVADNGLGYTAVAELAGAEWSGRALGVQNTTQNLAAVLTAPALAAFIGAAGYAWTFAAVAAFALLAAPLTPMRAEAPLAGDRSMSVVAPRPP